MTVLHLAAGLYALYMLVRHAPLARRGQLASILACVAAVAVLAMSARGLLPSAGPGR
jgi:hypothetical protein